MIGLYRIIIYAILTYFVFKIIRFFSAGSRLKPPKREQQKLSGLMVKDNICNTYLPKENAVKEIHQGEEMFFCSTKCQNKFRESQKKQ
ncbi:hypothetical protein ACFLT9_05780 [Acidobacteriota bacterium]